MLPFDFDEVVGLGFEDFDGVFEGVEDMRFLVCARHCFGSGGRPKLGLIGTFVDEVEGMRGGNYVYVLSGQVSRSIGTRHGWHETWHG